MLDGRALHVHKPPSLTPPATTRPPRAGVGLNNSDAQILNQRAVQHTLSPVLRSAWDGRPLALLTRTAPARATAAHVSVIGHITATELRHHTTTVELANGFLNRFLLIACRRVRLLPEGGQRDPLEGSPLQRRLPAPRRRRACRRAAPRPGRTAALVGRLHPPVRARVRDRRRDQRARRSAHDPPRAPLRADRRRLRDPARAPRGRARAPRLRRPQRPLGARPHHRRTARRRDPRRAATRRRRPHAHPAARPLLPQPARRPRRPSARRAPRRRQSTRQRVLTAGRPAELWTATPRRR